MLPSDISSGYTSTLRQVKKAAQIPVTGAVCVVPSWQNLRPFAGSSLVSQVSAPSFNGISANYDGTDDASAYNFGSGAITSFTIVFSAEWPTYTTDGIVIGLMHNSAVDASGLLLQRTSGHYYLFAAGGAWPSQVDITDNVRHSIAIVQGASTRGFYVDGTLVDSSNNPPVNGFGRNVTLGGARVGTGKKPGKYSNLAVYESALSGADRALVEAWSLT